VTIESQRKITSDADIGELIRERRKATNMSQSMLASLTGVDQGNLSKIERGEATGNLDTYLRLLNALGVDMMGMIRR
jgi:transcriptional regulator with XRE-family HTH domain